MPTHISPKAGLNLIVNNNQINVGSELYVLIQMADPIMKIPRIGSFRVNI